MHSRFSILLSCWMICAYSAGSAHGDLVGIGKESYFTDAPVSTLNLSKRALTRIQMILKGQGVEVETVEDLTCLKESSFRTRTGETSPSLKEIKDKLARHGLSLESHELNQLPELLDGELIRLNRAGVQTLNQFLALSRADLWDLLDLENGRLAELTALQNQESRYRALPVASELFAETSEALLDLRHELRRFVTLFQPHRPSILPDDDLNRETARRTYLALDKYMDLTDRIFKVHFDSTLTLDRTEHDDRVIDPFVEPSLEIFQKRARQALWRVRIKLSIVNHLLTRNGPLEDFHMEDWRSLLTTKDNIKTVLESHWLLEEYVKETNLAFDPHATSCRNTF